MKIDTTLLVLLKGSDLVASTAYLTLTGKMGYSGSLLGIKRFDFYRLMLDAGERGGPEVVALLRQVLDRQSTFYNRNKHMYSLECRWNGDGHHEGFGPEEVENRWTSSFQSSLKNKAVTDFDGKDLPKEVILNGLLGFLVEVMVEDEDPSARDSIAAKLQADLGGIGVSCVNRATLWWLALGARDKDEAAALAWEMTVTKRRDAGLLLNPNYQHAELLSVREIGRVLDD